ncbi:MAG: hypothetical protein EOS34_20760 [Mesorhizobium sp.]|nr:MAG: hypothetical protein EOS34_20760 [Mesorhizobium sp.]
MESDCWGARLGEALELFPASDPTAVFFPGRSRDTYHPTICPAGSWPRAIIHTDDQIVINTDGSSVIGRAAALRFAR